MSTDLQFLTTKEIEEHFLEIGRRENKELIKTYFDILLTLKRLSRYYDAEACCKKMESMNFTVAELYILWAWVRHELEDDETALKYCMKASAINSSLPVLHKLWGIVYQGLDRYEDSLECFEKSAIYSTTDPNLYAYLKNKAKPSEIKEVYKDMVMLAKDAELYSLWGTSLVYLGRYEESLEKFERAEELGLKTADFYYEYAGALMRENPQKALFLLDEVEKMVGKEAQVYSRRGMVYYCSKNHKSAIECYLTCIRLGGGTADEYLFCGHSYASLGEFRTAVEMYEKAEQLGGDLNYIIPILITALEKLGDQEALLEALKKKERFLGADMNLCIDIGVLAWTQLRFTEAIEYYKKAERLLNELDDTQVDKKFNKGFIYDLIIRAATRIGDDETVFLYRTKLNAL